MTAELYVAVMAYHWDPSEENRQRLLDAIRHSREGQ